MNYDDLTEEQFDCMAEQLVDTWHTLAKICEEAKSISLVSPETLNICKVADERQMRIAKTLGQDQNKEPQWPPVRKWKVGLTQRRVIEFIAEIEVEAADEYEAEQLARDRTEDWAHSHEIEWEESQESASDGRELDDETWCCEPV